MIGMPKIYLWTHLYQVLSPGSGYSWCSRGPHRNCYHPRYYHVVRGCFFDKFIKLKIKLSPLNLVTVKVLVFVINLT